MKGIELNIRLLITSADLFEIAEKMRTIEQMALPGNSAIAKQWFVDSNLTITFQVDQERAKRKGLIK